MDAQTTTAFIGTVGFPIVAYFSMYQMCKDTIQKNTNALENLRSAINGSDK